MFVHTGQHSQKNKNVLKPQSNVRPIFHIVSHHLLPTEMAHKLLVETVPARVLAPMLKRRATI